MFNTPTKLNTLGGANQRSAGSKSDAVIVGTSGGDSGVRGFVAAYDAVTGKQRWLLWTIPEASGESGSSSWPGDAYPHGGAHYVDARYL